MIKTRDKEECYNNHALKGRMGNSKTKAMLIKWEETLFWQVWGVSVR